MSSREKNNNLQFGLTIPQGWRGGDLPLEEENNPVKQYVVCNKCNPWDSTFGEWISRSI